MILEPRRMLGVLTPFPSRLSLLCGLSPGVQELIGARIVQAAGGGPMVPTSLSLLLASVPAKARSGAIGAWSAVGALGAVLGRS